MSTSRHLRNSSIVCFFPSTMRLSVRMLSPSLSSLPRIKGRSLSYIPSLMKSLMVSTLSTNRRIANSCLLVLRCRGRSASVSSTGHTTLRAILAYVGGFPLAGSVSARAQETCSSVTISSSLSSGRNSVSPPSSFFAGTSESLIKRADDCTTFVVSSHGNPRARSGSRWLFCRLERRVGANGFWKAIR